MIGLAEVVLVDGYERGVSVSQYASSRKWAIVDELRITYYLELLITSLLNRRITLFMKNECRIIYI